MNNNLQENTMHKNIILAGVGGQGTILASRLLADAAMRRGLSVRTAETIGMAQRGGSVQSHVRIGEDLHSPLIAPGEADLIIGFEPAEAVRLLPWLREGGAAVVSDRPVMPVSAMIGAAPYPDGEILAYLRENVKDLCLVPAEQAAADLQSYRVLNVLLLGAAAAKGMLGFSKEELLEALRSRVPERFLALNEKALGYFAG